MNKAKSNIKLEICVVAKSTLIYFVYKMSFASRIIKPTVNSLTAVGFVTLLYCKVRLGFLRQ